MSILIGFLLVTGLAVAFLLLVRGPGKPPACGQCLNACRNPNSTQPCPFSGHSTPNDEAST